MAVQRRVRELRAQGVNIVDFGHEGDTPQCAKNAAAQMLDSAGAAGYGDSRGLLSLREVLAAKLAARNNLRVDPDSQILVTVGAKQAIFTALLALVGQRRRGFD